MYTDRLKESHCFTEKCQSDFIYINFAVGKTMSLAIEEKWGFPWIGALILKLSKSFGYSIFGS